MPIYEYSCDDCNRTFEELVLRSSDEDELRCPSCGSEEIERLISASSIGKGGGGSGGRSCGTFS